MHRSLIAMAIFAGAGLIPLSDIEARSGGVDNTVVYTMHVERYHMDIQHMEERTAHTVRMLQERIAMHEARLELQKQRLAQRTCDRLTKLQSRSRVEQVLPSFCGGADEEGAADGDGAGAVPETGTGADLDNGTNIGTEQGAGTDTGNDGEHSGTGEGEEAGQGSDNDQGADGTPVNGDANIGDGSPEEGGTDSGTDAGNDTGNGADEGGSDGSGGGDTTGGSEDEQSEPTTPVSHGRLVISEVLYSLVASQGSEGQGENEWIELYNGSDTPIDLAGYTIGDSAGKDVLVGEGLLLLPGAYAIITPEASTFTFWDIPTETLSVILNSKIGSNGLGNGGDAVYLYDPENVLIDAMSYGTNEMVFPAGSLVAPRGSSLARVPVTVDTDTSSDWVVLEAPTPGR